MQSHWQRSADYFITSKQNGDLGITTDGSIIFLGNNYSSIRLTENVFAFDDNMVLDVPEAVVDAAGRVQLWERNNSNAQMWGVAEINGYYMICWHGYALTYDLNDNSIRLMPITGEDSQLWSMNATE